MRLCTQPWLTRSTRNAKSTGFGVFNLSEDVLHPTSSKLHALTPLSRSAFQCCTLCNRQEKKLSKTETGTTWPNWSHSAIGVTPHSLLLPLAPPALAAGTAHAAQAGDSQNEVPEPPGREEQ